MIWTFTVTIRWICFEFQEQHLSLIGWDTLVLSDLFIEKLPNIGLFCIWKKWIFGSDYATRKDFFCYKMYFHRDISKNPYENPLEISKILLFCYRNLILVTLFQEKYYPNPFFQYKSARESVEILMFWQNSYENPFEIPLFQLKYWNKIQILFC